MKTKITYILLGLSISLFMLAGSLNAQKINFSDQQSELFILENSYATLRATNVISEIDYTEVKSSLEIFTMINTDAYGYSMDIGDPRVPVMKKIIEIPLEGDFQVNILNETYQEFSLAEIGISHKLMPTQAPVSKSIENPEDIKFDYNPGIYNSNDYLYTQRIKVIPLGIMRGVRLARLEIYPVQYNPVQNKIKIFDNIQFEINFVGADVQKTINLKKDFFSPFFESNFSQVVNFKNEFSDELIMDEPVTYVIVSDIMFQAALQPFIQWKTKKGFKVIEGYTNNPSVGTTTTSIKSYLQGLYNSPPAGYNSPSFVLFVGDIAQIPVFSGTAGSHYTDLYYCEYTGDLFPEVYYGRFSAENLAELQPQIDKTLEYEQYLMPDPTFLNEVVMIAGADGTYGPLHGNGQINYGTTNYFNASHGLLSHTYLQPEPSGGNYSTNIRQNVSDGVGYANYTAHCSSSGWADPSFSISNIAALTNAHQYPLMVGNCCLSNKFDVNDCFGEELLQAVDKGAVGYVGGSNNTYWDEDYWWGVGYRATVVVNPVYNASNLGAYDRTFHDHGEAIAQWFITQGQMPSAGNFAVTQSGSSMETYYWEIYHLMGDPSMMAYFSQPPVTTATYQALMPLASTTFNVQTQPYAYVAISKNGVLHGAAIADATGLAEVTLTPITTPGIADIVVTRQNGQPFIGTVTVASPTGPYLSFDGFSINDNAGNNNGNADYNETITLNVTIENLGSATASNVSASIASTDSYINITDNANAWPNIPAGSTSLVNGAFGVIINNNAPDQHEVIFDLIITNGSETWTSTFNILLNAPSLSYSSSLVIDDLSGGNGNGRLDPGETANVTAVVENNGHSLSPSATATLTSASPYITINSGNDALGQIATGNSTDAVFNITCSTSTPVGQSVDLTIVVDAGNYGFSHNYYTSVGLLLEDWELGNFTRFPWTFSGNANWTIANTGQYEGLYTARSGVINHSQTSEVSVLLSVTNAGVITYYRKVSSESGYDYLRFYIDGVQQEAISGEVAWGQISFPVTAGVHTFKWGYSKDGSVVSGSDCAWVDYIVFPPSVVVAPEIVINPASFTLTVAPDEIATVPLSISNAGNLDLSWSAITQVASKSGESKAYCTASGTCDEYISNVVFNTINNSSACSQYADYTSISTTVTAGETYNITVTNGVVYTTDDLGVWIDWNQDQDFTDAGENVVCAYSNSGQGTYAIAIPETAVPGATRMRIRIKYSGDDCGSSCGATTYGEVEDYTVIVEGANKWLTITPASGTITQGNNQNPAVTFDATGLAEGTYTGSITVNSNDSDEGQIVIPCTMIVANGFELNLTAMLEGPVEGAAMLTPLNLGGYLPLMQPYNMEPWNYTGTESVAVVPANVVDWVLVELRDATSPANATSATRIARQAAFILSDGSIVGLDGSSILQFSNSISQQLYAVVHHRNHLGILSASAIINSGGVYNYDFTTGYNKTYGGMNGCKEVTPGIWGMIGGDANCDGQVQISDMNTIWNPASGSAGYLPADFNLDGQVDNQDKDDCWAPNFGNGCQVPE